MLEKTPNTPSSASAAPSPSRATRSPFTKYYVLALVTPTVVTIDQITKISVLNRFRPGESISVVPEIFNLTFIRNQGAAFGFLSQLDAKWRIPFFLLVPFVALAVITVIFRKIPGQSRFVSCALSLVMSGAIGNLIDRVRFGSVIDFLDFHWKYQVHFPAFNVADSAICVGVAMLLLDMFLDDPNEQLGKPDASNIT